MPKFAENTQVPADRSRAEIERIITRYGADQFMYGWDDNKAVLGFRVTGRMVHLKITLPDRNDNSINKTPTGRERSDKAAYDAFEKETRRRWRSMALLVKAKLEAIELGFSTIEREFLADLVLPNGSTVGDFMLPQIKEIYSTGKMPKMLPGPKGK